MHCESGSTSLSTIAVCPMPCPVSATNPRCRACCGDHYVRYLQQHPVGLESGSLYQMVIQKCSKLLLETYSKQIFNNNNNPDKLHNKKQVLLAGASQGAGGADAAGDQPVAGIYYAGRGAAERPGAPDGAETEARGGRGE